MNLLPILAILGTLALADEPGPAALVVLLHSADRVEREEAARTLEELGPEALPALHLAEKSGLEPSRSRARSLARRIEGKLLLKSMPLLIDNADRPLGEALRTFAGLTRHSIELDPADPSLAARKIHVFTPASVSFWEALDLIGRAGHVRHDPGAGTWDETLRSDLRMVDGDPPEATLYRGVFRVHLPALHRRRDLDLTENQGPEPTTQSVLYVDLQAFAEPGRFLDAGATPRFEATDDRGRPLPAAPASAERSDPANQDGWQTPGGFRAMSWKLAFGLPEPGATRIGRIKGTLPVIVSAVRPDSLVIALDDPPGQSYRQGDETLRFSISGDPAEGVQLDLTLSRKPGDDPSLDDRPRSILRHRLVCEDRDGKLLSWLPQQENGGTEEEWHVRMTFSPGARPARLRFHDVVWTSTEIAFEFLDVELP